MTRMLLLPILSRGQGADQHAALMSSLRLDYTDLLDLSLRNWSLLSTQEGVKPDEQRAELHERLCQFLLLRFPRQNLTYARLVELADDLANALYPFYEKLQLSLQPWVEESQYVLDFELVRFMGRDIVVRTQQPPEA